MDKQLTPQKKPQPWPFPASARLQAPRAVSALEMPPGDFVAPSRDAHHTSERPTREPGRER